MWQQVIDRYAILRTRYVWETLEKLLQMVLSSVQLPFLSQDWRELTLIQQKKQLMDFLIKDREQGFDLSQAPLMRCAFILIADAQYYFVWSFHHLQLSKF